MSIIEWHRSRLRASLHYIEPTHLLLGNSLSLFFLLLMVDQTDDIFHIEHPCSFNHNQIHIKQNIKVLSPTNTLKWTHIAMCSNITLQLFFVKIAYNYFSSANGHISEVITHTHRSSFIVVIKRERERRKGVKMIFLTWHTYRIYVWFPFIAYLTHITGYLSTSVQSKNFYFLLDYFICLIYYININFFCCLLSLAH